MKDKAKWYRRVPGFRSGSKRKAIVASVFYIFLLIGIIGAVFGEDSSTTFEETASEEDTSEAEEPEVEAEEEVQVQDPEAIAQEAFGDDLLDSTYNEQENTIDLSLDFGDPFFNSMAKSSFEGDIEDVLIEYTQLENVPSVTFDLIGEYEDVNEEEVMNTVYLYEFSADTIAGFDSENMPDLEEAADTFVDKQEEIDQEQERIEEEEAAEEEARQEEEERKEQKAKEQEEAEEQAAKEKEEAEKQAAKEEEEKQQEQEEKEKEKEEQKAKEKAEQDKKKEQEEAEKNNDESSDMINDNVLDHSYDIMLDYEGVKDVHAEVDEDSKTISLAIIVGSATNEERAKDLADSFIRSMASGAGIYGDETLDAPDNDSLGELYDYYDLHVGVATSSEEYIVQGAKAKGSQSLVY